MADTMMHYAQEVAVWDLNLKSLVSLFREYPDKIGRDIHNN